MQLTDWCFPEIEGKGGRNGWSINLFIYLFRSINLFIYLFIYLFSFTTFQWVLSYIDMNQPWSYMYSPS